MPRRYNDEEVEISRAIKSILKEIRTEKGMSFENVATKMTANTGHRITRQAIQQTESLMVNTGAVGILTLCRFCEVYEISLADFFKRLGL